MLRPQMEFFIIKKNQNVKTDFNEGLNHWPEWDFKADDTTMLCSHLASADAQLAKKRGYFRFKYSCNSRGDLKTDFSL